jgi:hypothetical protein
VAVRSVGVMVGVTVYWTFVDHELEPIGMWEWIVQATCECHGRICNVTVEE